MKTQKKNKLSVLIFFLLFDSEKRFNVDENDIKHFSSYAEDWWNPEGSWKVLHVLNQARVPFIRDGLISPGSVNASKITKSNVLKGFKILDVGCGAGILSEALASLGAEVVGLDPSEDLIRSAKEHIADQEHLKLKYFCELIEDHAAANKEKYDAVVASEVVEHVVDKKPFLKSCVEALKPGGSIYVTTLNKSWWSWICAIIFAENILGLLPKNTHIWDQFISPEDVSSILKEFGCHTLLVKGFRYEFFRSVFKIQNGAGVEYGLHAVKSLKK